MMSSTLRYAPPSGTLRHCCCLLKPAATLQPCSSLTQHPTGARLRLRAAEPGLSSIPLTRECAGATRAAEHCWRQGCGQHHTACSAVSHSGMAQSLLGLARMSARPVL